MCYPMFCLRSAGDRTQSLLHTSKAGILHTKLHPTPQVPKHLVRGTCGNCECLSSQSPAKRRSKPKTNESKVEAVKREIQAAS